MKKLMKLFAMYFFLTVNFISPLHATSTDKSDWGGFAHFWALSLAVEDGCEKYFVKTDPIMGNYLSASGYEKAKNIVEELRAEYQAEVQRLGCDKASRKAASHSPYSYHEVWEVEE